MEMSAEQLRTLRGLLREGVDDAAAAFLAGAEAAQNPAVRLSGTQLAELQGLLQDEGLGGGSSSRSKL